LTAQTIGIGDARNLRPAGGNIEQPRQVARAAPRSPSDPGRRKNRDRAGQQQARQLLSASASSSAAFSAAAISTVSALSRSAVQRNPAIPGKALDENGHGSATP